MQASFHLMDIYQITGIGVVVVGNVTQGTLVPGMKIGINGKIMEIKSIQAKHKQLTQANEGMAIGISLRNGDRKILEMIKGKEIVFADQVDPKVEHI